MRGIQDSDHSWPRALLHDAPESPALVAKGYGYSNRNARLPPQLDTLTGTVRPARDPIGRRVERGRGQRGVPPKRMSQKRGGC
jgi:hypothetical protein